MRKVIFKLSRDFFPQSKDRYPLLYFEHGRIEVDDSSVKWVGANRDIYAIPVATISTILLGPGTTVTHESVKAISSSNTTICWVGDDSLRFYAAGITPTADTRNLLQQIRSYVLRCQGVKEHFLDPQQTPVSYSTFERPTIVRWGPPNGDSNRLKALGAQCYGVLPRLLVWFAIKMPAFRAFPFAGTQEPLPMRTRIGKVSR